MKDCFGAIQAIMKWQSSKLNPQPKRATQLNEVTKSHRKLTVLV